ncbi:MAG: hypothetical protein V1686_01005 [Patescibacteria group bacterium]
MKYNSLKATRAVTGVELDFIGHAQGLLPILQQELVEINEQIKKLGRRAGIKRLLRSLAIDELIKDLKGAIKRHGGKV